MAHVAPIYPNFARGEVSPMMFGRIDIEQYPSCLDKCRNTYIRPYGCATRLTGTEFVSDTKNSGKVRLLKFVFSATDSYIIECGAGYFRFYQNGAAVIKSSFTALWNSGHSYKVGDFVKQDDVLYYCVEDNTSDINFADDLDAGYWVAQDIYEIPNDYYEDQLDSIQYVQLDDIIKLTCLPHNDDNTTARPKELIRKASDDWEFKDVEFKEVPYLDKNTTDITLKASAVTGNSITIEASEDYFTSSMVGTNFWLGLKVTDTDTNKDVQGYVKITAYTDATHVTAEVKSKLSGTSATKLWGEGAFSDYRGYPSVVALYDGRLYYARTPHQPRNVYGSKPYAYETFTPAVDNEDDAGINIALATNANGDGSDIKWLIGASYLLCGTYGGEFVIRGTGDGAITPTDISARQRTNWGGEPIQPIVAGTFVHFIQRNGNKLRQFQYDFYYDSYKAVDCSIFSEHLLASPIKQMALQKNPDSIIYLMREDGNVVMLTLEQDQSVQAWSLLEELGAKVESIQTIPSYDGNYDEVYMVMARQTIGTTLSYTSSNPSLTITNNYTGTKEVAGTEVVILTYNGTNGVWTDPASDALNTKFSVTSPNPSLNPTSTYSGTKSTAGTITDTLECIYDNSNPVPFYDYKFQVNNFIIEPNGNPEYDDNYGIVSSFANGYYTVNSGIDGNPFLIQFKTNSTVNINDDYIFYYDEDNYIKLIKTVNKPSLEMKVQGNAALTQELKLDTWYIIQYLGIMQGWVLEENGSTIWQSAYTLGEMPVENACIGAKPNYGNFSGMMDLNESYIGFSIPKGNLSIIKRDWFSQTTHNIVDINSNNYKITLADIPLQYDILTCVWNTVAGYAIPSDYGIAITGTPSNNDTITLTYVTDFNTPVRFIERMMNPVTTENPKDWWYVRSGLKYDGYQRTEGIILTLSGSTGTVTATAASSIFTSSMVGNRIRLVDKDFNVAGEGTITAYTSGTVVTLEITTYFESIAIQGGQWGISTDTLSGLDHLNGRTVQVYADAKEQATKVVTDGSIDIDDAFVAVVGLPYRSYITTMPMEAGSQNGTAVGKRKRISEMAIRVWNSIGVRVGRDLDNLYETIYEQKEPFTGVIPNIKYNQGWVWDANITVEQSHPYPMNILSIAPIVTEVDK